MDAYNAHIDRPDNSSIEQVIAEAYKIVKMRTGAKGNQVHPIGYLAWLFFLKCLEYQEQRAVSVKRQVEVPALFNGTIYTWSAWRSNICHCWSQETTINFLHKELLPRLQTCFEIDIEKIYIYPNFTAFKQLLTVVNNIDLTQLIEGDSIAYLYSKLLDTLAKDDKVKSYKKTGMFSTPLPLVRFMVQLADPQWDETIYDPACGTGNFFVTACKHIQSNDKMEPVTNVFWGYEFHPFVVQLCKMNMLLHNIDCSRMYERDVFSSSTLFEACEDDDKKIERKVILTHPPFGEQDKQRGQGAVRGNKRSKEYYDRQFLSHCMNQLREGSQDRCAIVVSQNLLLSERNEDIELRRKLVNDFHLLLVARLPTICFEPFTQYHTYLLYFQRVESTDNILYCNIPEPNTPSKKKRQIKDEDFSQLLTVLRDWKQSSNDEVLQAGKGMEIWVRDSKELRGPDSKYILVDNAPSQDENITRDLNELLGQLIQNSIELYGLIRHLQALTNWKEHTHDTRE